MPECAAFLVAGTKSGSGKTSVSLGIMAALSRRGLRVQPFKAGPDFIDPGHHALAVVSGEASSAVASPDHALPVASHNLDTWMLSPDAVREVYARYAAHADVCPDVVVVEGVMGLFDGISGVDEQGSSAHLAKVLDLPVVLVADAASMARSAAAMVAGYLGFDPELRFAGVVLNNVASPGHAELLRQALEPLQAKGGPPLLGLLPRRPDIAQPSRHLGLVTAEEREGAQHPGKDRQSIYDRLADWVEENLDLDGLLQAAQFLPDQTGPAPSQPDRSRCATLEVDPVHPQTCQSQTGQSQTGRPETSPPHESVRPGPDPVRIGMAKDSAFCFVYAENLRLLREAGAEIVSFSPLADGSLPPDLDGLYLPGGYPELHGRALEANASLRCEILDFSRSGRPVYAECGGFMYLMEELADPEGNRWAMAGVFQARAEMAARFSALGYREVTLTQDTLLGPEGTVLRGHEFHYSHLAADSANPGPSNAEPVYAVTSRRGPEAVTGWLMGNTLGSYVHLHFGSNPEAAAHLVRACAR